MKNRKVFVLLWGPSGCGKDYFVKNLSLPACKGDIQFTKPVLFTDRPMRANERQKEPYIFCTNNSDNFSQNMPLFDDYMDKCRKDGTLLSITTYDVIGGTFRYGAKLDIDKPNHIIMAASFFQVLDIFKWRFENRTKPGVSDVVIYPLFIDTDITSRLCKLIEREAKKNEADRNYEEILRRYIYSDNTDYNIYAKTVVDSLKDKLFIEMDIRNDECIFTVSNSYDGKSYDKVKNIVYSGIDSICNK